MKSKHEIVKAFIDKLGNVDDWDYYGDCYTLDEVSEKCVCGHDIKIVFIIENKKQEKKEKVGSVCIENFKNYNNDLYNKLEAANKKRIQDIKDRKKLADKIKADKEYFRLTHEINECLLEINEIIATWEEMPLPNDLWRAKFGPDRILTSCPKQYKRPQSYVKWAHQMLVMAQMWCDICKNLRNTGEIAKGFENEYAGYIWFGKHKGKKVKDLPKGYLFWLSENYIAASKKEHDFFDEVKQLVVK